MKKSSAKLLVASLALCLLGAAAAGETEIPQRPAGYANKPVTIVCPFAPGGATDNAMRALQPILSRLGVETVVNNVAGSRSVVGAMEAINATPDGYTVSTIGSSFASAWAEGMMEFSWDDVTFITCPTMDSSGYFVQADAPWKDGKELIEWIIAHPGEFTVGGTQESHNLMLSDALKEQLGGKDAITPLNFGGAARPITELLGGHIMGVGAKPADLISHIRSGLIRPILWFGGEDKEPFFENVQSFNDLPYGKVVPIGDPAASATIMIAAKGLKPEVAEYLQTVFRMAVASDEFQTYAKNAGSIAKPLTPEECLEVGKKLFDIRYREALAAGLAEERE